MNTVYLICGVSGSGKSWVCQKLKDKFNYIPHDDYIHGDLVGALYRADLKKPLITECPFGERALRENLEDAGLIVKPFFIFEAPYIIEQRFRSREGKAPLKSVMTRALSIKDRIDEWNVPHGTSDQIYCMLRDIDLK